MRQLLGERRPARRPTMISPCTMITASSATPRTVCANCSTTRIDTPSLATLRDDLVQLFDDDRRETHRQLVEEEERRVGGEAARHREHLLLAARQRARELRAPLAEPREPAVRDLLDLAAATGP